MHGLGCLSGAEPDGVDALFEVALVTVVALKCLGALVLVKLFASSRARERSEPARVDH